MSSHIIPATSLSSAETVISSIINNGTSVTIEQQLTNHLDGIPRTKRLQEVQDLLLVISEAEGLVAEIASKVWTYVMTHKLWESKYPSLEAFKESIAYDVTIHELLKRYGVLTAREQGFARSILANWQSLPFDALPIELHPPKFSRDLLQFLSRLSKICSLDKAIVLLKEQVRKRQSLAGPTSYSKLRTHIITVDVMHVYQDLQSQMVSKDNRLEGRASGDNEDNRLEGSRTSDNKEDNDEEDSEGEDSCADSESVSDMEIDISDSQPFKGTTRRIKKSKSRDCSCFIGVKEFILSFKDPPEVSRQAAALADLSNMIPLESLCRNHLRQFTGTVLNMLTNIKTVELLERLKWINLRKRQFIQVKEIRSSWFRGQSGTVWREILPVFIDRDFDFDPSQIFNRFAGPDSWQLWLKEGTMIIPNVFDYLQSAKSEIDSEFAMYDFHLNRQQGLPTMGWMRNMYHSGPQQLIYQDPILWALTAAARPDKHWRLISYPYNAKSATSGQKTGFLHMDLNLKRYQSEGLGKNMVQSSVSLTDENIKGCTLVVPGFHKCFHQWVRTKTDEINARSSRSSTTDMKGMYTTEDCLKFGKPEPAPCPAWGIRLSRSDIIHGSTKEGNQLRQVISPWFTGINEDHKSLENPDCMNWEELSKCHKDLTGPTKESLGDEPRKGVAGIRFPGALPIKSVYSLPQALVGIKQWTDPDVIFERNILLGPDDKRALEMAKGMQQHLVDTYKHVYPLMEIRERAAFQNRSFFVGNDTSGRERELMPDEEGDLMPDEESDSMWVE